MTDKYVETVDYMIVDGYKAFKALSTYINDNFCRSMPLPLDISDDMRRLLTEVVEADNKKKGHVSLCN